MCSWSSGGGLRPTRVVREASVEKKAETMPTSKRIGTSAHSRQRTPVALLAGATVSDSLNHQSTTSKKPIQPSSVNSD